MSAIIPRWEWRTFGHRFGRAEEAFAAMTPTGVQETDELYLLAPGADTVKVRFDLMDVKTLREVDSQGLERWEPVFKVGFPMAADDVGSVAAALRLDPPHLARPTYTLDQFLAEVAGPTGLVRPVTVHKRRVRYVVGGCTAEVSDVSADGRPTRTIAIEDPDPVAVLAAIEQVGLDGYVNTGYPKGLLALIEDRPVRFAVIDVGTNSVKFHVGEREAPGRWRPVLDRADVTRLGEGLEASGEIIPAALDRTASAIAAMVTEARALGVHRVIAVGTAGLRASGNQAHVLAEIRARTGITVRVISGEDEARLAYVATVAALDIGDAAAAVFDTGGGSTQFTYGHGTRIDEQWSAPIGAVRITERFGLAGSVGPEVIEAARAAIAGELHRVGEHARPDGLVGMGGAVTNLAAVKHGLAVYDPAIIQGTRLDRAEVERQIELYRSRDADARRSIVGLQPQRAEVILAGACIVAVIMDLLEQSTLSVSDRGLRHGVLAEESAALEDPRPTTPAQPAGGAT